MFKVLAYTVALVAMAGVEAAAQLGEPVVVLGCPDPSKQWHAADFLQRGIELPAVPSASVMECRGYWGATSATGRRTIR